MVELPRQEAFGKSVEPGRENGDAGPQSSEPLSQLPTRSPKLLLKRSAYAIVITAAAGYAAHFGFDYWTTGRFIESTDDAYVKADYTTIAPKVAG
jgi:membrane fusion protein (multidrug efflux system)